MTDYTELTDEELVQEIEDLNAEVDEHYNNRSFEMIGTQKELDEAIKEAKNRGYNKIDEMK